MNFRFPVSSKNLFALCVLVATLINASPALSDTQHCKATAAGLYVGQIPGNTSFLLTATPLNNAQRDLLVVIDTTGDADPTARSLFPSAVGQSNPRGIIKKVKGTKSTWEGQLVRLRYDSSGAVVGTEIQGVSITKTDCNSVQVGFVSQAFFFGFVNPGETELPAADVVVDVSGFPAFSAKLLQTDHVF